MRSRRVLRNQKNKRNTRNLRKTRNFHKKSKKDKKRYTKKFVGSARHTTKRGGAIKDVFCTDNNPDDNKIRTEFKNFFLDSKYLNHTIEQLKKKSTSLFRSEKTPFSLGTGQYGDVVKGTLNFKGKIPTAIKITKNKPIEPVEPVESVEPVEPNKKDNKAFADYKTKLKKYNEYKTYEEYKKNVCELIYEAYILKKIGYHPNVVEFFGLKNNDGNILLFLEFCEAGSLVSYLEKLKAESEVYTSDQFEEFKQFMIDVCLGMEHIHSRNIVHRDIAARNVLLQNVDGKKVAKVSDVGLSRELEAEGHHSGGSSYKMISSRLLPPRMAPEVKTRGHFTTKTDIWAFGILMLEIFGLTETDAFKAITKSISFEKVPSNATAAKREEIQEANQAKIEKKKRDIRGLNKKSLCVGESCPKDFYEIMKQCLSYDPMHRPEFSVLKDLLQEANVSDVEPPPPPPRRGPQGLPPTPPPTPPGSPVTPTGSPELGQDSPPPTLQYTRGGPATDPAEDPAKPKVPYSMMSPHGPPPTLPPKKPKKIGIKLDFPEVLASGIDIETIKIILKAQPLGTYYVKDPESPNALHYKTILINKSDGVKKFQIFKQLNPESPIYTYKIGVVDVKNLNKKLINEAVGLGEDVELKSLKLQDLPV